MLRMLGMVMTMYSEALSTSRTAEAKPAIRSVVSSNERAGYRRTKGSSTEVEARLRLARELGNHREEEDPDLYECRCRNEVSERLRSESGGRRLTMR
jgi:hypothetical protein